MIDFILYYFVISCTIGFTVITVSKDRYIKMSTLVGVLLVGPVLLIYLIIRDLLRVLKIIK